MVGSSARTHGSIKRAYLRAVVPRALRGARTVIVPSAFVRDSVLARTDLAPSSVVVVPHGVERGAAATAAGDLVNRYGLDGPMVLYPAITYPHKGHATLVEAFARVLVDHPYAPSWCSPADPTPRRRSSSPRSNGSGSALGSGAWGGSRPPMWRGSTTSPPWSRCRRPTRGSAFRRSRGMAHGVPVVASDGDLAPGGRR